MYVVLSILWLWQEAEGCIPLYAAIRAVWLRDRDKQVAVLNVPLYTAARCLSNVLQLLWGKGNDAPQYSEWSSSQSQAIESIGGYTTESVTHGQCDARPTVTFPANGRYQFTLLGEQRHMCVNNLPRVVTRSGAAETWTRDLSVASPTPSPLCRRAKLKLMENCKTVQ